MYCAHAQPGNTSHWPSGGVWREGDDLHVTPHIQRPRRAAAITGHVPINKPFYWLARTTTDDASDVSCIVPSSQGSATLERRCIIHLRSNVQQQEVSIAQVNGDGGAMLNNIPEQGLKTRLSTKNENYPWSRYSKKAVSLMQHI